MFSARGTGLCQPRELGQNHTDRGDIGHQKQPHEDSYIIPEHVRHGFREGAPAHLDGHKQGVAYGRRDVANAQVVHQHQAEVDGVHAEGLHDRQEQGVKIRMAGSRP